MAKPVRRLGRGLDSLISHLREPDDLLVPASRLAPPTATGPASPTGDAEVRVGQAIVSTSDLSPNPFQPRAAFADGELASLKASIEKNGLLQPIVVRRAKGGFEIIAGERRWRAARDIGWKEVPVMIRDAGDEAMLELALIENLQREDLNAMDRARAYRRYCDSFDRKPEEVAMSMGEDRTTVVNYLRLLELPDAVQSLVAAGSLSMGHARSLLGLSDEATQTNLAKSVVDQGISVRALEHIVRQEKAALTGQTTRPSGKRASGPSAHILDLEKQLEKTVKTKVTIREGRSKGTGRIVIEYYSLDDFDRVTQMLGLDPEDVG